MAVYIGLVVLGAAMTIETFLRHALLRSWYDLFLALPVWLGWFLAATALYFLLLYLLSLTVDKTKPVQKKSPFYRWLLNETAWLILRLGRVKIECSGLEKLQGLPPFLLVANHRSNFDPFIAIAACPKYELAYIAKPEIFDIPITGRSCALRRCCGMAPCPSAFIRRGRAAKRESFSPFATARFKSQSGQARPL